MATRRERVVLELEDQFTTGMARAAASAALLNKELNSLSRDSVRTQRSFSDIDSSTGRLGRNAGNSAREVDKLSGRMRILADVAAVLGPSLVPIGGVGVAAVSGLAAQLGFAATAGATAVLAFQGIGNTLKALNKAALEPTQANLEAATAALEGLSPAAQGFVQEIGSLIPELTKLQHTAAQGFFPGATQGLTDLASALPRVQSVVAAISTELGNIAADTGASLASDRWKPFLEFVAREAPSALAEMATAAGNTAHAVASLWIATTPLNEDFSVWLVRATQSIDRWATSLSKTQGFADFVAYVEHTGPKVAATLGAIANAAIQIVQATAPLGGPVLDGVKALANVIAAVANSDIGTPLFAAAAGLALFNRTLALTRSLGGTAFGGMIQSELGASAGIKTLIGDLRALQAESRLSNIAAPGAGFVGPLTRAQVASERLRKTLPALAKTGAIIGAVGLEASGAADKINITNTASLALAGSIGGPWTAAAGAAIGATIDLSHATDDLEHSLNRVDVAARTGNFTEYTRTSKDLKGQLEDLQHLSGVGDTISDGLKRVSQEIHHPLDFTPFGGSPEQRIADALAKAKVDAVATRTKADMALLADGFNATAEGADNAAQSTHEFQRSLEKLNEVLTGRASFRDFEQSLDDFTDRQKQRAKVFEQIAQERASLASQLAGNDRELTNARGDLAGAKSPSARKDAQGRISDLEAQRAQLHAASAQRIADLKAQATTLKNSLDVTTQAGRDTQELLDNIASTALKVAQGLDPTKRAEFLAGARQEFVKTAISAGLAKDAAQQLADRVLGLSTVTGKVKIVVDANGAWQVITQTQDRLRKLVAQAGNIPLRFRTDYIANQLNATSKRGGGRDGDPGTPYAEGGWTGPGTKYQPAGIVHAEEFVVKRGPAARFRSQLEHLNRMPGYANGGYVQPFPPSAVASTGLSAADLQAVATLVAASRPLYGDVNMQPHNYNQFRRDMENDRRMASSDGVLRP